MTRRWFAWLPFVGVATAQSSCIVGAEQVPCSQAWEAAQKLDSKGNFIIPGTLTVGPAYRNGQCPVCGLVRDGKVRSGVNLVRCARCSAAFWQDSNA